MRRLVMYMMISLDGYLAPADGAEDWMVGPDPDRDEASLAANLAADVGLIGHGVYHDMVGYWPTAEAQTPVQARFIERANAMPKLVVTHAETDLDWNCTALVVDHAHPLPDVIGALKQDDGGDIVFWGGAELAAQLAAHDLIDEYQLFVQPVALGSGRALFGDLAERRPLRLVESRSFGSGVVFSVYIPERKDGDD